MSGFHLIPLMTFERIEQIIFIIVAIAAVAYFVRNVRRIRRNILLGKEIDDPIEDTGKRWRLVLLEICSIM